MQPGWSCSLGGNLGGRATSSLKPQASSLKKTIELSKNLRKVFLKSERWSCNLGGRATWVVVQPGASSLKPQASSLKKTIELLKNQQFLFIFLVKEMRCFEEDSKKLLTLARGWFGFLDSSLRF